MKGREWDERDKMGMEKGSQIFSFIFPQGMWQGKRNRVVVGGERMERDIIDG